MPPQLQLALDGDLASSLAVLAQVHRWIDIIEVGTPLIYREGVHALQHIRAEFPAATLLADLKIMDAGDEEASIGFAAGAHIVTVLGVAADATVRGAVAAAQRHSGRVMADMMQVRDVVSRGRELLALGVDILCVHTAYDLQASGATPLAALGALRSALPDGPLAAAGGISLATLNPVLALEPRIVIVGGAITRASDPAAAAQAISERMRA
jgi:3-hexulose-6-phosphate synthase